jgi:hypothetical protein
VPDAAGIPDSTEYSVEGSLDSLEYFVPARVLHTSFGQLPGDEYTGELQLHIGEYTKEAQLSSGEYARESITNMNNSTNIEKFKNFSRHI